MSSNDSKRHHQYSGLVSRHHHSPGHDRSDALRLDAISHSRNARSSLDSAYQTFDDSASIAESIIAPIPEPKLPDLDLPQSELDLTMTFESILAATSTAKPPEPETDKIQKRASNVMKLAQENEKLKEELRAMNARLEAAERKQAELRQKEEQARRAQLASSAARS